MTSDVFCRRLLEEARVLMFPGTSFGHRWETWVRVSLLQPVDRLSEALSRIERFVGAVSAAR
jgi:aspartate/methionine/tyrosine aminotransferase